MVVFADTFYFLALLDQRDEHHKRVLRFAASYREELVTTRWVLAELANALGGSPIRVATVKFLQRLENDTSFRIIGDNDSLYERGFSLYAARPDKEWSLTDWNGAKISPFSKNTNAPASEESAHHLPRSGINNNSRG